MANPKHTVSRTTAPHGVDLVVIASRQMAAATNDADYECARNVFMRLEPTTPAGAQAKLEAALVLFESMREGDELTEAGWAELYQLLNSAASFEAAHR